MQKTTNYGLNKPESTDFYDVNHMNTNMDVIDEKMNGIQTQLNSVASGLGEIYDIVPSNTNRIISLEENVTGHSKTLTNHGISIYSAEQALAELSSTIYEVEYSVTAVGGEMNSKLGYHKYLIDQLDSNKANYEKGTWRVDILYYDSSYALIGYQEGGVTANYERMGNKVFFDFKFNVNARKEDESGYANKVDKVVFGYLNPYFPFPIDVGKGVTNTSYVVNSGLIQRGITNMGSNDLLENMLLSKEVVSGMEICVNGYYTIKES